MIVVLLQIKTKGRALEEMAELFGDGDQVAGHWYNTTAEEKEKLAEEAMKDTADPGEGRSTHEIQEKV